MKPSHAFHVMEIILRPYELTNTYNRLIMFANSNSQSNNRVPQRGQLSVI